MIHSRRQTQPHCTSKRRRIHHSPFWVINLVWDATTHDQIGSAIEHTGKVEYMAISTNDTVIGSDERITLGILSHRTNMHTILSYLSVVFPAFKEWMVCGTAKFGVSASAEERGERRYRQSTCPTGSREHLGSADLYGCAQW